MKLRKSLITAAIAAAVALGAMGQAQASVYGGAFLEIDNLVISTTGVGDPAVPINYIFNLRNTATLNGTDDIQTATCQGVIGPVSGTDCNAGGGNVLDAAPAQVGTTQADNNFSFLGPGGDEYARGDSVIIDAQLVDAQPTRTASIAESELQASGSASASSDIQSTTGLTFVFDVSSPGTISVSFDADIDLLAHIAEPGALIASAQASTSVQFLFSQDNTDNSVTWNPETVGSGTCADATQSGTGIECVTDEVGEDLNQEVSVNTVPNSEDAFSRAPANDPDFTHFDVTLSFTEAGRYTLSLTENKQVQVSLLKVPEPTTLLLLGSGLFGLGFARRRVRKA